MSYNRTFPTSGNSLRTLLHVSVTPISLLPAISPRAHRALLLPALAVATLSSSSHPPLPLSLLCPTLNPSSRKVPLFLPLAVPTTPTSSVSAACYPTSTPPPPSVSTSSTRRTNSSPTTGRRLWRYLQQDKSGSLEVINGAIRWNYSGKRGDSTLGMRGSRFPSWL